MANSVRRARARRPASSPASPGPPPPALVRRRIVALDGVRGLLAVVVVLGHALAIGRLLGAFVVMDLFFVMSGFLVVRGLYAARCTTGRWGVPAFYRGRFARLGPPLLITVAVTWFVTAAFAARPLPSWEAAGALLGFYNVHAYALGDDLAPDLLRHTWSLSLEEQFYVALCVGLLLVQVLRVRTRYVAVMWAVICLLSVVRLFQLEPDATHSATAVPEAYYRTELRLFQFLAGALVALAEGRIAGLSSTAARACLRTAGVVLAGLWCLPAVSTWLAVPYKYVSVAAVAASVLLLVGAAAPAAVAPRLLLATPLTWLGERCYGVYVIHYPLLRGLQVLLDDAPTPVLFTVYPIALVALTHACYELVERPSVRRWGRVRRPVPALPEQREPALTFASWTSASPPSSRPSTPR